MRIDKSFTRWLAFWLASLLLAVAAGPARAQNETSADDPPGRVGRLADVLGQAWLFHPEGGEWTSATRNMTVTSGDRLSTDPGARAEVRIGSTTLRLDGSSELEVVRLDDERVVLQLHSGGLAARFRSREVLREYEFKTGEGRFRVQRAGRFRIDRQDDTSFLTVYTGQAQYEGPGSALTVYANQRAEFWLDGANAAQYSITEPVRDAFSAWNSERDRADDRSVSQRYVSPEMTGVEDLDRHGRWEQSDEYGPLWFPRAVAPGWAPYSTGHWAWVRPWGWTWVDDAPWGFAPFHYGRWVWFRSAWCWAPGTYVARPVFAPALVAWVGGPHLSVSISIGNAPAVGWFPLAPREVYVPSYRVSPGYVRNVNVTHVTNITNITTIINNAQGSVGQRDFSNRKFPHAVTVVPASVMTNRQPVAPAAAQYRDTAPVREFTSPVRQVQALIAAPVAAPPPVVRSVDPRVLRPAVPAAGPAQPNATVQPGQPTRPSRGQAPGVAPGATERAGREVREDRPNVPMDRPGRERREAELRGNAAPTPASPGATGSVAPATRMPPAPVTPPVPAARPVPPVDARARTQVNAPPAPPPGSPRVEAPATRPAPVDAARPPQPSRAPATPEARNPARADESRPAGRAELHREAREARAAENAAKRAAQQPSNSERRKEQREQ